MDNLLAATYATERQDIVAILRRHPRYDDDFAKAMPNDVDADRWTFPLA